MKRSLQGGAPINQTAPCPKMQRLSQAFSKALDVSVGSLTKDDINNFFGSLTDKYGNMIQSATINELERTRRVLESKFVDMCDNKDLNNKLLVLENHLSEKKASTQSTSSPSSSSKSRENSQGDGYEVSSLLDAVLEVKSHEAKCIAEAIESLQEKIDELTQRADSTKSQALEQIEALAQENNKIANASKICIKLP